ncbi:hypothetical protein BG011_000021 [Mortierella polycephala]|uniref:Zn(2)-C6 fungal-type domain-containing protein n=1 Tax=Mortierella polycephala TaxID=41804 RepID=A0A9P6QI70_9FUNG|nr:hypothetical protein BG011_000021 [Mortierella polycephala]
MNHDSEPSSAHVDARPSPVPVLDLVLAAVETQVAPEAQEGQEGQETNPNRHSTRTRTHSEKDLVSSSTSPLKASTLSASSRIGSRGPIPPRPGVFRPCARCRVKKTRCDKAKPSCSNCQKAGVDVICIYDNDEPTPGVVTSASSSAQMAPCSGTTADSNEDGKQTKVGTKKDSEKGYGSRSTKTLAITEAKDSSERTVGEKASSKVQNHSKHRSRHQSHYTSSNISNGSNKDDVSKRTSDSPRDLSQIQHTQKKIKTGANTSGAIKPSPLRTSIGTATSDNFKSPISPKELGSKRKASLSHEPSAPLSLQSNVNKTSPMDQDSLETNDKDNVVLGLSIKEIPSDEAPGTPAQERHSSPAKSMTASSRSKKQAALSSSSVSAGVGVTAKASWSSQSKIIVELTASKPPPVFVIDKNQKTRKWGKRCNIFQTLGGEVTLPLWTSDQEMLLNEPKPLYIQRSMPLMSTRKENLSRLAVLSHMDFDTPERGNTPESHEGSPSPSTPPTKRKRAPKRQNSNISTSSLTATSGKGGDQANNESTTKSSKSSSFKRARAGSGQFMLDDNQEDGTPGPGSNARSTPVPTTFSSTKGASSQRPRKYPCSFEGCNKSFMDKFHLDRHEARHVTEEIVCGIDGCTKAYNSISTVRRHQSIMHKDRKEEFERLLAVKNNSDSTITSIKSKAQQAKGKEFIRRIANDMKDSAQPSLDNSESSTRASSPMLRDVKQQEMDTSTEDMIMVD